MGGEEERFVSYLLNPTSLFWFLLRMYHFAVLMFLNKVQLYDAHLISDRPEIDPRQEVIRLFIIVAIRMTKEEPLIKMY